MQTYRVLLIGNGEKINSPLLRTLAHQARCVVAVDGGADAALQAGLLPDYVIGDLDSVSAHAKKILADKLVHVRTQENTDLEKALRFVCKQGFTHATVVGFVGGRWDFSVGNLLTLACYARKLHIVCAADNWTIYPLCKRVQLPCKKGKRVSIIPLKTTTHVTLRGCKYPLTDACLSPGTTRTISNQTTAKRILLDFARGTLLLYLEN